ncbi:MAG: hypothetical protein ABIO69_08440 [Sphingomicrobium sp.]
MKSVIGGILVAVGILIAGASGLCSLAALIGSGGMGSQWDMVPLIVLVGGIPLVLGGAIAFGGRALIRQARIERDQAEKE